MAHRYFEGKAHALLYKKFRSIPPPQLIQRIISYVKEKPIQTLETAVDVGCGSGQSTEVLAPYFGKVIGTDISENMVQEATTSNAQHNVSYKVTPADKIPAENSSVQLITVSQAAHWLNLPKFYEEARRVLCPHGVLAIYGYCLPSYRVHTAGGGFYPAINSKNTLLQKVWDDNNCKPSYVVLLECGTWCIDTNSDSQCRFYHVSLRNCWDAERKQVDNRYANIVIPYDNFVRDDSIFHEMESTVSDIGNYVLTWSGYQTYCKKNGDEAGRKLIQLLLERIMIILGASTPPSETTILKRTTYFLLMARKSDATDKSPF